MVAAYPFILLVLLQLIIFNLRPGFIRFFNITFLIFIPLLLNLLVVIKIQFTILYRPCIGFCRRFMTCCSSISAIATVLGCIMFWRHLKTIKMCLAGKKPFSIFPFKGIVFAARHGFAVNLKSYGIEAFNGLPICLKDSGFMAVLSFLQLASDKILNEKTVSTFNLFIKLFFYLWANVFFKYH